MNRFVVTLAALVLPLAAAAQPSAPVVATPLLPPGVQSPPAAQPPPPPPGAAAAPSSAPRPIPATWLPQGSAVLQLLDKVNAQNAVLTVKVGQSAQFGSLTIQVQACEVRPPGQPQDAAAFLTIEDSHAGAPGFRGWMVANDPSLSMLQHPIYDVRVVGCKA